MHSLRLNYNSWHTSSIFARLLIFFLLARPLRPRHQGDSYSKFITVRSPMEAKRWQSCATALSILMWWLHWQTDGDWRCFIMGIVAHHNIQLITFWYQFIARTHDDIITWKHFPYYWPFSGKPTSHWWSPSHNGPVMRSFDVFCYQHVQTIETNSRGWCVYTHYSHCNKMVKYHLSIWPKVKYVVCKMAAISLRPRWVGARHRLLSRHFVTRLEAATPRWERCTMKPSILMRGCQWLMEAVNDVWWELLHATSHPKLYRKDPRIDLD